MGAPCGRLFYKRKSFYFYALTFGGFIKGVVFKIESKDYYIYDSGEQIRCNLPGRFQKEFNLKKDKLYNLDIAVVGDEVEYDLNKDNTGTIAKVGKRKNYISRKAPRIKGAGQRGERLEQVIASNIDSVFIVSSTSNPSFNNRFVDRLIVSAESAGININIVINKTDLGIDDDVSYFKDVYTGLGYNVYLTSVFAGESVEKMRSGLEGKVNLFFGPSGVGKSSLLNALYPELNFRVGEVSASTSKGKHTTVTSVMTNVGENTFIIDTPGIREFDPYGLRKEDLGHYFREISEIAPDCKFNTCTHNHEPGCAVIAAVEEGKIAQERYVSYFNLLETIEEGLFF